MRTYASPQELAAELGNTIGPSDWLPIDQDQINAFANATGDRQWIHVDVERAAREMPDGKTIAHGYLLLSLLGKLQPDIYAVTARRVLNVGLNKMRFLMPVPVGSRIRLKETVKAVEESKGGLRITNEAVVELQGSVQPALIAEIIFLYFP
jgi:acyl dehydratase